VAHFYFNGRHAFQFFSRLKCKGNPEKRLFWLVLCLSYNSEALSSQTLISGSLGKGGGEYVFETGNRFPNLSGIRGGSRISFPRDPLYLQIQTSFIQNQWEWKAGIRSTGWNQKTSEGRDEDFFLFSISTERSTNIATREFSYYDTTHVYTGTRNFADGKGKTTLVENQHDFFGRYYFRDANPDPWKSSNGFFLSLGARYSYFKYALYDVNQFVDVRPVFLSPIGLGLTFSNDLYELFYGLGYRITFRSMYLETVFLPSQGRIITRDFHLQRNINFLSDNYGAGFLSQSEVGMLLNDRWLSFFRISYHRFFSEGNFKAKGGFSSEDILSNYLGGYKSHINIKDYLLEFGCTYKSDWVFPYFRQQSE